jgi:hypothetical protein
LTRELFDPDTGPDADKAAMVLVVRPSKLDAPFKGVQKVTYLYKNISRSLKEAGYVRFTINE